LTFADVVEKAAGDDNGRSRMAPTHQNRVRAERLHLVAAYWRVRPKADAHPSD
jgi:hypothetical protein